MAFFRANADKRIALWLDLTKDAVELEFQE